jgi:hypothetical protein
MLLIVNEKLALLALVVGSRHTADTILVQVWVAVVVAYIYDLDLVRCYINPFYFYVPLVQCVLEDMARLAPWSGKYQDFIVGHRLSPSLCAILRRRF